MICYSFLSKQIMVINRYKNKIIYVPNDNHSCNPSGISFFYNLSKFFFAKKVLYSIILSTMAIK